MKIEKPQKCMHALTVLSVSSDSETEEPSRKYRSISDEQQQEIGTVLSRIDEMERTLKSSMNLVDTVTELKKSISLMETECAKKADEKHKIEECLANFKNSLSCIVCKSLAKFPWKLTPCCHIILCVDCGDRWLESDPTCPHC